MNQEKKMKKLKRNTILAALLSVTLISCATNEFDARIVEAEEKSYQSGIESANKAKPLIEIKGEFSHMCTAEEKATGNCSFTVFNPSTKSIAPQRKESTSVALIREVKETVLGIAPIAGDILVVKEFGKMVDNAGKNSGDHTTISDSGNTHSESNQANQSTINTSTDTSTETFTETVGGDKAGGDINNSQQNQANPVNTETNTDDNSIHDSNNPSDSSNSSVTNPPAEEVVDDNDSN